MLKIRVLLALCLAFAMAIAVQLRDGAPALEESTSSALIADAQISQASRQSRSEIAHRLQTGEKPATERSELDETRSRHDGKEMMHLWARQNSTPSSQLPLSLSTATLTRTSFIEVPSETQVVVSTLVETVTVVDPIFVTKTSTVAIPPAPSELANRGLASSVASYNGEPILPTDPGLSRGKAPRPGPTSLSSPRDSTSSPDPTTLITARRGVRRQLVDAPMTVIGRISIVTIETTVTLTRTGSFVSTATVVNPIIVSVTANPTSTTTLFITAGAPTSPAIASTQKVSTITPEPTIPTTASVRMTISTPVQTSLVLTSLLDETSTSVFSISSSTSSLGNPTSGITTWFTDDPDGFTWPTVAPTSTSTQISASITASSTVVPDSGSSLAPALNDGQIAGIVVGSVFGIAIIALAIWLLRKRSKRRQHVNISEDDYQMTSAAAAAAIIDSSPPIMNQRDSSGPLPSNTSGESSRDGNVRIVIQPTEKRRTQSSGLFPIPKIWPQPPGYDGKTYSFSAGESAESSPREPITWSNASEYGGSSNREGVPGSGTRGNIAMRNQERVERAGGASGSRF